MRLSFYISLAAVVSIARSRKTLVVIYFLRLCNGLACKLVMMSFLIEYVNILIFNGFFISDCVCCQQGWREM